MPHTATLLELPHSSTDWRTSALPDKEEPLDIRRLASIYVDVLSMRPGTVGAYALAVLSALAATALRVALAPYLAGSQYITFFPAVMVATLTGGFGAGLICALLSFAAVVLLIRPLDPPGVFLFVVAMLIDLLVAAAMRFAVEQYRELSQTLERRVEARTAEVVQRSRELDERNRQLGQAHHELMAVYDQGLFASHLNMEGRIVHANRACVEDLGFARADIIGKLFWEAGWWYMPESQEWIHKAFEQAAAGTQFRGELSYVFNKDGSERVTDIAFVPIKDEAGRVISVFVPGTDITDRARQYRATFENAAVGIAHLSSDLRWLRANQALCRILGWPMDECLTKSLRDVSHPDDLAVDLAYVEQMRAGKIDSYAMDKRYLRKDGTIIWGGLTVSCVRRNDGSIDYFVAVIEDISARKRAEQGLRKSEERFRTSILHSPVPTALFNDREQVLAVSQSWLTAAGFPSAAEFQRLEDWTIRGHGERSGELLELVREVIATEPEARTEELILTLGGEKRVWNFVASYLGTQSDGRRLFVAVAQDVTDRKAYEERIKLLVRESHHRIKNILSLVQAVARQTAARQPERFIESFNERIQALAANHDLLVESQWQGADVEDLVRVQLAHFEDLLGSRIAVHGPRLRLNAAAAQAVGLAVHELATNASKYGALSTDGGRVDVDWRSDSRSFGISWTERGGPPVRPPDHRGFGSTVIELMAKRTVGGQVELDYAPSGFGWHLTCPAANALEATADNHTLHMS